MKKDLTTRQKSFVKHIASGNSATKSAELAGYSKKSARLTASKLLTNDNILQQIEDIFDKAGLKEIYCQSKPKFRIPIISRENNIGI